MDEHTYLPPDQRPGGPLSRFPRKGWKTYAIGFGTIFFSMLGGIDWNMVFSGRYAYEMAAVAGAGVVLGRAIVSLFKRIAEDRSVS